MSYIESEAVIAQQKRYIAALEAHIDALKEVKNFNEYIRVLDKATGAMLLDKRIDSITMILYGQEQAK